MQIFSCKTRLNCYLCAEKNQQKCNKERCGRGLTVNRYQIWKVWLWDQRQEISAVLSPEPDWRLFVLNSPHTTGVCQHSEKKDRKQGCGSEAGRQLLKGFVPKHNITYTLWLVTWCSVVCYEQDLAENILQPLACTWPAFILSQQTLHLVADGWTLPLYWLFKRDDVGNFLWLHSITPETFSG